MINIKVSIDPLPERFLPAAKIIESRIQSIVKDREMKPDIIVSVSSAAEFTSAKEAGPDIIEIRIDLAEREDKELLDLCEKEKSVPKIATIRSKNEGGKFEGTPEEWFEKILPWTSVCEYIDIERSCLGFTNEIRASGRRIIASVHLDYMPDREELVSIEEELRSKGDIPKIIVTPSGHEDVLTLSEFTLHCSKPVITGVMGNEFRWARALCCLFGSSAVFCYAGKPASEGQYRTDEMRELLSLLG